MSASLSFGRFTFLPRCVWAATLASRLSATGVWSSYLYMHICSQSHSTPHRRGRGPLCSSIFLPLYWWPPPLAFYIAVLLGPGLLSSLLNAVASFPVKALAPSLLDGSGVRSSSTPHDLRVLPVWPVALVMCRLCLSSY